MQMVKKVIVAETRKHVAYRKDKIDTMTDRNTFHIYTNPFVMVTLFNP